MSCSAALRQRWRIGIGLLGLFTCFPNLTADDELRYARLVYPRPRAHPQARPSPAEIVLPPLPPTRLAEYVPAELPDRPSWFAQSRVVELGDAVDRQATSRRPRTTEDRRQAFEREYGVHAPSPSAFKAALQHAKYGVDSAIFAALEMEETIEDRLNVSYSFERSSLTSRGTARRRKGRSNSPVIESDVDLSPLKSEAYLGVRLVVPWRD